MKSIINQWLLAILLCGSTTTLLAQTSITSNLPIIAINAPNGIVDEPKRTATISVFNNPNGINNNAEGILPSQTYSIGIEYRGSTSQSFPKKPFSLETRNNKGENLNVPLLNYPIENDWAIITPYNDKTLLRDHLAYSLSRKMGRWASRTHFVELFLNNSYYGVGFLAETIKQGENRVNIAKLKTTDNSGDELTGGYVIKIDKTTGAVSPSFQSQLTNNKGLSFSYQIESPKNGILTAEQYNYIRGKVYEFENSMKTLNFDDPINGYAKYIDISSMVDFFIINELSRNVDGYRLSSYMYKDKDSKNPKLMLGPVWDFNLAWGNANYCDGYKTTGWAIDFSDVCPEDGFIIPVWWKKAIQSSTFRIALSDRWNFLRKNVLSTNEIFKNIDSTANVLDKAQVRNFQKWPVLGQYVWPNYQKYIKQTYPEEVTELKRWITERIKWLDAQEVLQPYTGILAKEPSISTNENVNVYYHSNNINISNQLKEKTEFTLYSTNGLKLSSLLLAPYQNATIPVSMAKNQICIWQVSNPKSTILYRGKIYVQ
jgi:hypothetical protein